MAQKARKDRARANEASLKALHIGSAAVNALFITWCFILPFTAKRSIAAYIILSIPAVVAQYILESTGRPRYVDGQMKNSGEDLAAPGLTEYLFDIVWITWTSLISVIFFGNWGWLLFTSVPVFGLYKGWGLLGMARGMAGGANGASMEQQQPMAGNRKQRRMAA